MPKSSERRSFATRFLIVLCGFIGIGLLSGYLPAARHAVGLGSPLDRLLWPLDKERCTGNALAWYRYYYSTAVGSILDKEAPGPDGHKSPPNTSEKSAALAALISSRASSDTSLRQRPEWRTYATFAALHLRWYEDEAPESYWQASCKGVALAEHVRKEDEHRKSTLEDYCRSTKPVDPAEHMELSSGVITCADLLRPTTIR